MESAAVTDEGKRLKRKEDALARWAVNPGAEGGIDASIDEWG